MQWPLFNLNEAINLSISATATILSVLLGGWLAFRFGVRQLRHERALDRRLEWQEKLLAAIYEYITSLRVLISEFEKPFTGEEDRRRLRDHVLGETTQRGRDVQALLGRADLYGTLAEREDSSRLFKLQIEAYTASWTFATKLGGDAAALTELKSIINSLYGEQKRISVRIREELGLPLLPDGAAKTDQTSPNSLNDKFSTIHKTSNIDRHEDTSCGKTITIPRYSSYLFNPEYQMVFLTLIIALATITNVYIFWSESKSTSLQSKAALDATIDNFRLEQRAWVGLGFISTGNLGIGQPFLKEGQRLDASIPFKNSGESLAKNVKISMTSQFIPNGADPIKKQQTATIHNISE